MNIFDYAESSVRSYCRMFPGIFTTASGSTLQTEHGDSYLDFFCGAGALNYGHNPPVLQRQLIQYIENSGVTHSLDMHTAAKRDFIEALRDYILLPRDMDYVMQFTGPTGTNAVEAALRLGVCPSNSP